MIEIFKERGADTSGLSNWTKEMAAMEDEANQEARFDQLELMSMYPEIYGPGPNH